MFWLGFIIGLSVGGFIGVSFMVIFQISKTAVDNEYFSKKNNHR